MDKATTPIPTTGSWTVHIGNPDFGPQAWLVGVYLDEIDACEALDSALDPWYRNGEGLEHAASLGHGIRSEAALAAHWGGAPERVVPESVWISPGGAIGWYERHDSPTPRG